MIKIVENRDTKPVTLNDYAAMPNFAPAVSDLRAEATLIAPRLAGRNVWMVNSTDAGGGVAEMLPRLIPLLRELGFSAHWAVIQTENVEFFNLTKRLHNLIHGDGRSGRDISASERETFEAVNRDNADSLKQHLGRHDILVVHDPQPVA
jgi:trehalose synthase